MQIGVLEVTHNFADITLKMNKWLDKVKEGYLSTLVEVKLIEQLLDVLVIVKYKKLTLLND